LVLGVGLAFLLERVDRRYRDPRELEETFDRPLLATVPVSRTMSRRAGPGLHSLPPQEQEAFRMLRANLRYFDIDREVRSVLVTSAAPGDGKSTVAWQLAAAAASPGTRVLLLEADLRHPSLGPGLGVGSGVRPGLSSVLAGQAELEAVVEEVSVGDGQNGRSPRTIDVVLAGHIPPNPHDLIDSQRMHDVLAAAKAAYDFVVIDTPPTSVVSDAIPLVRQVDGVIVVARLLKSTRPSVTQLKDQLQHLGAPILGIVVNAVGRDADVYQAGYEYGARYYTEHTEVQTRA
jgi:capsular exopolysaccharide synthesis family protein